MLSRKLIGWRTLVCALPVAAKKSSVIRNQMDALSFHVVAPLTNGARMARKIESRVPPCTFLASATSRNVLEPIRLISAIAKMWPTVW